MVIQKKNKKKLILVLSFCVCILIIFLLGNIHSEKFKQNDGGNRTNNDTFVSVGVFDKNGKIIDNGSNLDIKNKETLHHTFDIEQQLNEDRDYLLITMVDFKQVPFIIDGKSYDKYYFNLNKSDKITFDLKVNVSDKNKELDYIIIKKPNYMPETNDFDEMISLQSIMTSRFCLNNQSVNLSYENNVSSSFGDLYDYLWISDNEKNLNALHKISNIEPLYMSLGNDRNNIMDFAVVIFSDWEQISFDENFVKYFELKPDEKQVFELKLPIFEKDKHVQAIAFPMPYNISKSDVMSLTSFGTFKFIVENK